MQKKSPKRITESDFADGLELEEISSSMTMYINSEGERVYMHEFNNEVEALEFIEIMAASLRADIFETLMKRSVN